ncbi:site-specific integrase, partial [Aeromonas veronii]
SPEKLQLMVTEAKKAKIGSLQDKLRAAGKSLWPARKSLPTFYSWRHQMGSELKASGLDRQRIAYIMGHQATSSVDKYGNR